MQTTTQIPFDIFKIFRSNKEGPFDIFDAKADDER